MSLIEIILLAVMACAIVAVCVAMGLLYARMMPYHLGRPFGVSASNSGIDAYTELGSRIHMAWDEMRLLEVQTGGGFAKRCFSLYAPGKRIDWAEYSTGLGTRYVPVGATSSDMTRRQAALLGLIVARTGLAPRTLAKTLVSKPAKALEHKATKARDVKRLSKGVVLLAGISAAGFLFPVTPSALVNWASAGSLAFLALWLLLLTLRLALARSMSSAHANPPAVDAPSLDAPDVAYSFNWRIPLLGRLGFMVAGLCLAVNLVPGVWGLVQQVTFVVSHLHPQLLTTGILITLLVTVGRFMLAFSSSLGYLEWCWPTWRRSWRKFTFAWTGTA